MLQRRSDGADAAEMHNKFNASGIRWGHVCLYSFHHIRGSVIFANVTGKHLYTSYTSNSYIIIDLINSVITFTTIITTHVPSIVSSSTKNRLLVFSSSYIRVSKYYFCVLYGSQKEKCLCLSQEEIESGARSYGN